MSEEFVKPKPKSRNPLLNEDEYLRRLEIIIKRDFYPELYRMDGGQLQYCIQDYRNEDEHLSLNEFLSTYTSEENVTLNNIIQREDERWYQKNAWMFQVEEEHRLKQQAIQSSKLQNMIEGNRDNNIHLNEFKALNPLYFKIDHKNEDILPAIKDSKENDEQLKVQQLHIQNTRFDDHHKPLEFAISQINSKLQKRQMQEHLNGQGINVDYFGTTPNLVGVHHNLEDDMIGLFSPAPNQLKSPLMTWGVIGETPVRLDRSYMIPPSPTRDRIGNNLAQQLNVKKRNEQKQQEELLKRRLSSITPNRIGSSISQRANSELIKNFFQMRGSNTNTPMSLKSKKIAKIQPTQP